MSTGKKFEITQTPMWVLTLQDLSGYSSIKKAILDEVRNFTSKARFSAVSKAHF